MITSEEIDFIGKEYSVNGVDPTSVLAGGRLSWISTAGPRQQMFTAHLKQAVMLNNPESPKISTGHEKFFGKKVDSFKKSESDFRIIAKISRFSSVPNMTYVLVLQDIHSGNYDVVKVKHYEKMTDCHGYMKEETSVDRMYPGQIIPKGEYFYKASTIDEYENYRYGINCKTMHVTKMGTIEDSIICSKSMAERASFTLIEKIEFTYDANHVMLNLYGDRDRYKCLPNIMENTSEDSILCGIRQINKANIASDLTVDALRNPKHSDTIIKGRGKLIDISIHTNNPEQLLVDEHRCQINSIYLDELRYHQEIVNVLGNIVSNRNNNVSDTLRFMLVNSRNYVDPNVKFANDTGTFDFCHITAYVAYETKLNVGYKMTDRFGGKGVIGEIRDDELMPVDEDGVRCDLIIASAGTVPRLNLGRKYEHELSFIADKFVKRILMKEDNLDKQIRLLKEFCSDIDKDYGESIGNFLKKQPKYEQQKFIREIAEEGLYIQLPPINNIMNLNGIKSLYDKYDIKPGFVRVRKRYYDEPSENHYVTKEYFDKMDEISKQYKFVQPSKTHDGLGLGMTDVKDNLKTKNPLKLSSKTYKENKWTDDYVWDSEGVVETDDADHHIQNELSKKKIVDDVIDIIDNTLFNSEKTRIFKNEDGSITREFRSTKPVIIAESFFMVLKHIPEANKFSARNLGPVSLLGLPTKTSKNCVGKAFPDTANRCGEMETECLNRRIPNEITARWMATHATNPEYVMELAKHQLLSDPLDLHDVDIENDIPKDTIPARVIRAYLASLGINILASGEEDPFEWFDKLPYEDVDDMLHQIKRNKKQEGK